MAALREESELYRKLDDMYEANVGNDISEEFFCECISVAETFNKKQIRFVLFKLSIIYEDVDTGIEQITMLLNSLQKVLNTIMGKNVKKNFIINVLEAALEEMS